MAACYAEAEGRDTTRVKTVHRLGSRQAVGRAQTWRTFAVVTVYADGSTFVEVKRDGEVIHQWQCQREG
jgi:hypothetical protein